MKTSGKNSHLRSRRHRHKGSTRGRTGRCRSGTGSGRTTGSCRRRRFRRTHRSSPPRRRRATEIRPTLVLLSKGS